MKAEKLEKHQPEIAEERIVVLPDGRTLIKKDLSGADFFAFQDAVMSTGGKKVSAGLESLALAMFVWADGSPLTISQLRDSEDDSVGFAGLSVMSEHMYALFTKTEASTDGKSLEQAK